MTNLLGARVKITVVCAGKLREKHFAAAAEEYRKRLARYADVEIKEVKDEAVPERVTHGEAAALLAKEGARLLAACPARATKIALAIGGQAMPSEGFSAYIDRLALGGASHLCFVVGGTLGLADAVLAACDGKISLSAMTFPHQLARVMLLEQVYRAFRISKGEPYHK